jgi:hypothetical protein
VSLEWAGGCVTHHELTRSVRDYRHTADFHRQMNRIRELVRAGESLRQIAAILCAEGFQCVYPWRRIGDHTVAMLLRKYGPKMWRHQLRRARLGIGPHEWRLRDLARRLKLCKETLLRWTKAGWIRHRRLTGPQDRVICWADADEMNRLCRLRDTRRAGQTNPPTELTTPKPAPGKNT